MPAVQNYADSGDSARSRGPTFTVVRSFIVHTMLIFRVHLHRVALRGLEGANLCIVPDLHRMLHMCTQRVVPTILGCTLAPETRNSVYY